VPKDLLKEWDQLSDDEKKMFLRQVDVFAAYVAYTDHEIGRVIRLSRTWASSTIR
jgi:arylsulfatase